MKKLAQKSMQPFVTGVTKGCIDKISPQGLAHGMVARFVCVLVQV
jgi:hypothetical protein